MKIRIKGSSIRLRISQSEVAYFGQHGKLEETTNFANSSFVYRLISTEKYNALNAEYSENVITVFMPSTLAQEFVNTQRVGFESDIETGGGRKLFILVEKDFKCLDNTTEDQSDNYPNPLAEQHGQ
jgi:hypothetical protein